jgi:membrane-bound serine protease (ClpP class)
LGAADALEDGVVDVSAPTLGDFIVDLDGRQVGETTLETAEVIRTPGEDPRRRPTVEVRFAKLGLVSRLLHSAASPSVAYLLLAAGLALIVLELFTAGIGMAATTGAACLVLSCYGLAVLPTRPYAMALLVLAFLAYAVDVQAGAPRTWTVVATVALAVGSVRLYEQGLSASPIVLLTVVGGTALLMVAGLPAMLRARFSTPTIGRESMVGELGAALAAVDPDGTVEVRGAPWRARTNRATPIGAGDSVRVVGIDGLLLEVEPADGGAKDYRKH